MTVVRDAPDLVALYIRPGAVGMRRSGTRGGPRGRNLVAWDGGHEPRPWHTHRALILNRPGDGHSVNLFWDDTSNAFRGWYVNLELPWRRSEVGFDSRDLALDILVEPDLSEWRWKDEDELAWMVEQGRYSRAEAVEFRREGERAVERVIRRAPPLDQPWEHWRPDPSWPLPTLPDGWDRP
jgi:hypothetical protein